MGGTAGKSLGPYVFENIVDGVILLAADGSVAYANNSARDMLSIALTQEGRSLPGQWLQQLDPRNDDLCQVVLDALYRKHEAINRTVDFYNQKNERRILRVKSSYWQTREGDMPDGILLIMQDITAETRLQKEKEDAIRVFSLLLTAIGLWTMFYAALKKFDVQIPRFAMTYILLGMGLVLAVVTIWRTDLKFSDLGLSVRNIRKPLMVNVAICLVGSALMILVKCVFIWCEWGYFDPELPFFDIRFTLGMRLYVFSVPLQEILAQSVIHECLIRILKGKHAPALGIVLSAMLFTALHIHRGFHFMVGSLILVCLVGILYRKQRTVWGLCISHYFLTMMALFLHWI